MGKDLFCEFIDSEDGEEFSRAEIFNCIFLIYTKYHACNRKHD